MPSWDAWKSALPGSPCTYHEGWYLKPSLQLRVSLNRRNQIFTVLELPFPARVALPPVLLTPPCISHHCCLSESTGEATLSPLRVSRWEAAQWLSHHFWVQTPTFAGCLAESGCSTIKTSAFSTTVSHPEKNDIVFGTSH